MYAVIDTNKMKVIDLVSGDVRQLLNEMTELYKRLTGSSNVTFSSFEEAKQKVIEAVQASYMKAAGTTKPLEIPPPSQEPIHTYGPVHLARMVFEEMKGRPRKDIIEACARLGIKRSTASTQYQKWRTQQKQPPATPKPEEPLKPGEMPKLPPGTLAGH